MDFHAVSGDRSTHVLTTHRATVDETPLQLISAARMEYLLALEKTVLAYAVAIGRLTPPHDGTGIKEPG